MKKFLITQLAVGAFALGASGATTINAVNRAAYGANVGWMDWRPSVANGAVIGEFVCSGYIYSANCGWINVGSGSPVNGQQYQNNAAADYGLNHDGLGNLRGFAYGANIGWVNFEATGAPKFDLKTGKFTGYAYGANIGWISLSNEFACVQTDTIQPGIDTDGDGIADAWELGKFGNLGTATAISDSDGDGVTDLAEYGADTDPNDPNSLLGITAYAFDPDVASGKLEWNSRETRCYRVEVATSLNGPVIPWLDVGLGLVAPDAGDSTTRSFLMAPSDNKFFRLRALKPLSP